MVEIKESVVDASHIDWDLVEEQKKINKQPRFDWKGYLGISLTKAIAKLRNAGLDADVVYSELCKTHPDLSQELKRRLKIGIAARFGEMGTAESVKIKR